MSEREGEKPWRFGVNCWLFRSPVKFGAVGVKIFCGVVELLDCGVGGAGRFCGTFS